MFQDTGSVDPDMGHAGGQSGGIFVSGMILHSERIKDGDIGSKTGTNQASVGEPIAAGGVAVFS